MVTALDSASAWEEKWSHARLHTNSWSVVMVWVDGQGLGRNVIGKNW